ncbi:Urb2/Npa2 family-domain-containing protein [Crepidotus variabilis]|uniref:Urb2/Npa2 family-domain-containing protein n=1 Tax=Crepidotus variabilis TaxID=179855 RepID=A0A9P6JX63_9AGAR|nr:Urb2/Npa2 family-domain-containing protein [Crepidotus variabilis]
MSMAFLQSSQDFVRALKAQPDPPSPGGPTKIEIAEQAWANSGFYVPSKGEVIADWILTRLLKEKDKETSLNPILDERYWRLLHSILDNSTLDGVATNSWLTQLLHRIPLGPVIGAFLLNLHTSKTPGALISQFAGCVALLWPISSQRMNVEGLQESFGAFLHCTSYEGLRKVGILLTNSYRSSFSNSSSKKKPHQMFLQKYLSIWLQAVSTTEAQDVRQAILLAGVDVIFNLEVLRHEQSTKANPAIIASLQILANQDSSLLHKSLPTLFSHYVQTCTRHRGALFSQGSHNHTRIPLDKPRETAMVFFSSILNLVGDSEDVSAWEARFALLEIVDRENLFNPDQSSSSSVMNGLLKLCLRGLEGGCKEIQNSTPTSTVIQCMSVVTKVDYDLISPILPEILPKLLQISSSDETHLNFLELLLSYHIKTRTVDDFFTSVLSAISSQIAPQNSLQAQYQLFSSSSLMHPTFLKSLARATRDFMTESQCLVMTQHVSKVTKDTWDQVHDALSAASKSAKKTKKSASVADKDIDGLNDKIPSEDGVLRAISYTLVARFASVILSSLPTQALSTSTLESVRTALLEFREDFVPHAVSKTLKTLKNSNADSLESWGFEITLAANLRLLYAFDVSRNLELPLNGDGKMTGRLTELLEKKDEVLPELMVEVFRTLFYHLSVHLPIAHEEAIEHLMEYLGTHFSSSHSRWSSYAHSLSKDKTGRSNAALAILFMILERWLPQLDHFASKDQLSGFLQMVTDIDPEAPEIQSPTELWPKHLLSVIFHSAQFWEFRNIRDGFLELIDQNTAFITSRRFPSKSNRRPSSSNTLPSEPVSTFRFLLLCPLEYLTWSLIVELMKRAMAADEMVSCALLEHDVNRRHLMEQLILFRVFMKRTHTYASSGGLELPKQGGHQLVLRLLEDLPSLGDDATGVQKSFETATLDLIEVYLVRLLKASKIDGPEEMLEVLSSFRKSTIAINNCTLLFGCFGRLVDILGRDFATTGSVHEDVLVDLNNFHQEKSLAELPNILAIMKADFAVGDLGPGIELLSRHHTLLRLKKWLDNKERSSAKPNLLGEKLIAKAMQALNSHSRQDSHLFHLSISLFGVLLQELEYRVGPEDMQHLEVIVAAYIFLSEGIPSEGVKELDIYLSTFGKQMNAADYDYLLSFIAQAVVASSTEPSLHHRHLVHLASLLLRNHPSHSLIHIQKFATKCLGIFVNSPGFVEGDAELRTEVLLMVVQYCSDQQAALRIQDTSLIFLLIAKCLAPCPAAKHDIFTSINVFHGLISILTTLIRLRRDLVTLCLPHLGMILQRLICCTKGCRPNLGAKQTSLVMGTLPKWISASEPLGTEAAKALARLLESLTVKSTIRTISSSNQTDYHQKAESLSKPFSKHAAYVLKAHIEAMNDPLCILTLDVRKELRPGLFALCGMMSEHGRDTLMVSGGFGDGGKTVLKAVWQDWEATRYTGKG